jgi:hypothetical protein
MGFGCLLPNCCLPRNHKQGNGDKPMTCAEATPTLRRPWPHLSSNPSEDYPSWDNSSCLTFHRHFWLILRLLAEGIDVLVLAWCSDSESGRDPFHNGKHARRCRPGPMLAWPIEVDAASSQASWIHASIHGGFNAMQKLAEFGKAGGCCVTIPTCIAMNGINVRSTSASNICPWEVWFQTCNCNMFQIWSGFVLGSFY